MPNIDVINGQAEFINNHACVFIGLREIWKFMARKFLLYRCTNRGSANSWNYHHARSNDSTGLLNLKELPGHLGILGADILALSSPLCSLILAAR